MRSAHPSKLTILYNLVCGSGSSALKLHAIKFKGEEEQSEYTAGLLSRVRVPWALAARQSQSPQMSWTPSHSCCRPEDTNLEPTLTLLQASSERWRQGRHLWNTVLFFFPACGFTVMAKQHLCSRNKFVEQTNLNKIKQRDKKTGGQETCLTCFRCSAMRRNQKIALAPVVQKQCTFGRTW